MTPKEAKEVELSRNPITRHKQVTEHLGEMGVRVVGWGAPTVGLIGGRNMLVRVAEAEQKARFNLEVLRYAEERGVDERQATLGVITEKLETRQQELRQDRENNGEDI